MGTLSLVLQSKFTHVMSLGNKGAPGGDELILPNNPGTYVLGGVRDG